VADLLAQKRSIKHDIGFGRALLEIGERLEDLEDQLGIGKANGQKIAERNYTEDKDGPVDGEGDDWRSDESGDEVDDEKTGLSASMKRRVEKYLILRLLMGRHDPEHPFLANQNGRVKQIRAMLALDLEAILKQTRDDQARQEVVRLRDMLGEK